VLDRAVLDVVGGLPARALVDRTLEDDLLKRHFADLACLPVVRRNAELTWVSGSPAARQAYSAHGGVIDRVLTRVWDRRFGHRTYDVNGPGWRAVRAAAEPYRDRLAAVFRPEVVDELLPPPSSRIHVSDAVLDGHAPKLLVGLMLWLATHP
jgi:hypothetical protein